MNRTRTFKKDWTATEARNFRSKRSYVAPDGREVLYGVDWKARSKECIERDGGCQKRTGRVGNSWYVYCDETKNLAAHHTIHRGKLRDDRLENLTTRCPKHHKEEHVAVKWSKNNPEYRKGEL